MNSPIIIDLKFPSDAVEKALVDGFRDRDTINMARPENAGRDLSGASYALVWKHAADLFERAKDIEVIFSGGAGVDHILAHGNLPAHIPLVRFVDESLTTRMSEWVVMQCLMHLRQHSTYQGAQSQHHWEELAQPEACDITVGIMGLGILGADAAQKLRIMGFNVIGWSRTKKTLDGIETYDQAGLDDFLAKSDFLVGLLPLTAGTRGIFNAGLFAKLRQGGALGKPVFINAGRGGSQVEVDIVSALQDGTLGGASLDVFETEPLSKDSPLWDLPNVFLTPHAAAASDVATLITHVERQIARYEAGLQLEHLVDRTLGY